MLQRIVSAPAVPSGQSPCLVLLHGLGADERDLLDFGCELDSRLNVISLQAPYAWPNGGYAWFDIKWTDAGIVANDAQALESRNIVVAELRALADEQSKLFVGGFSQGAMLSLGAALAVPELLAGALLFSGRLLPALTPREVHPSIAQLPFLVQHGTVDEVVPVSGSREVRSRLEGYGCEVDYHEYPIGHGIAERGLVDARRWMAARLE